MHAQKKVHFVDAMTNTAVNSQLLQSITNGTIHLQIKKIQSREQSQC